MKAIRVLLVDDHAIIRDGLKKILSLEEGIQVIGEAADGLEAVELAGQLLPDVILMDINMPRMNGIEASRAIKEKHPQMDIVALTIHDDEEYVYELLRAGISGYFLKDIGTAELVGAIHKVTSGEPVFHPAIARKFLDEFRRVTGAREETPRLTGREKEVLQHVARGEGNREIARQLFISEKTVKNHLTSIFRKLGVEDRTQAVLYAVKHRLVKL